ncbi:hypothetical protein BH11PAT4_BH11PAT4_4230 [soil metagenome]
MGEVLGAVFGGEVLPPTSASPQVEAPIERRLADIIPEEKTGTVVEVIHATRPEGLPRFETKAPLEVVPSLASQAPTLKPTLDVRRWVLPSVTKEGERGIPEVAAAPAELPADPRMEQRALRRARRFNSEDELQILDQDRFRARDQIGQFEGALAALKDEIEATSPLRRPLLMARTKWHREHAEQLLRIAEAALAKKESRRAYLLKQAEGMRQLRSDAATSPELDYEDEAAVVEAREA